MPGRRRRRSAAPRWVATEWADATTTLLARSRGRCEHCGVPLGGRAERHHRQRRAVGGDRLCNLLLVLPEHHTDIHRAPERSRTNGWIVSAYEPDPAVVPVLMGDHWWYLDDDGHRSPVP